MQVQYARMTQESTYNTFDAAAIATNIFNHHLVENAVNVDPDPQIEELTYYDGHVIPGLEYSDRVAFNGTIRWPVYPGQEGALKYGFTPVSDVLPSFTLDLFDGIEVRRITGCRVRRGRLACSTRAGDRTLFCEYTLVGTDSPVTPPVFTEPASTVYPTGVPYSFINLAGNLSYGGASYTNIESAEIIANNNINTPFDEFARIASANYFGRTVEYNIGLRIKTSAERLSFQNQTPGAFSLAFTVVSPAHSITFTSGTAYIRTRRPRRPMREDQYQALSIHPIKDATSGTDMAVATV